MEKPTLDNPQQLNTNIYNTNLINNISNNIKPEAEATDNYFVDLPTNRYNTKNECFYVTYEYLDTLKELYPNTNTEQELRNMKGWLLANKTKRKTLNGMEKFITGWLGRHQNEGSYKPKTVSNYTNNNTIIEEDTEEMRIIREELAKMNK